MIFYKPVDCGDQSALDLTNAGILYFFLMEARSKEVIGKETKGFWVVPALVLHCLCYTLHLLITHIEFKVKVAVRIATSLSLALWLDIVKDLQDVFII